ncbi:LytR/AlgR family response regulator transcription factor [Mucilaginibacter lappiensis]|uniref:Two-component system LytT family response regulator n=1 Tax=Mucilaginibacter lappiensis TaxID=354630 RepID=A0A1N7EQF9_9SPHI|nr:response regulator [Mucilaginibacter lappiensis]MBB6111907.1 two-component system LytT family response regulator [Mucilaginibacter lappiensis]MBB6126573.1 two-component system LytT family response regulator [Mucilaginibacter lappiensis]SIR90282.1 two component transcriptional regulator, LytTR family [Mucilaginibacter lappiensis]
MKKLRVLIIDDERMARQEVKRLLIPYPDMELIGEAKNADEAAMQITDKHPDLLFLDIQMPERSGFELLESLNEVPEVIFTTAFDEYAVKAFEVNALDYLMKPIREERFALAIEKVRQKLAQQTSDPQIFVKDRQQFHFIKWSKVHLIESMDNYARLYFEEKNVFLKSSLNQLEEKLDASIFFRINRSQIINLQFIQSIQIVPNGRLQINLKTGEVLEVSDRQSVKLRSMGRI